MKYRFLNPDDIVAVVIVMVILVVGIYAFFVTSEAMLDASPDWTAGSGPLAGKGYNLTTKYIQNTSTTAGTVFNILGIVITIGAIMSIIGVIYGFLRPRT